MVPRAPQGQPKHTNGSEVLRTRDLGWARIDSIRAKPGPFVSRFSEHAVVVSYTPTRGPLRFNGVGVVTPEGLPRAYSVFRPNDVVTGTFSEEVTYDILVFSPGFVRDALQRETAREITHLPPVLRLAPQPVFMSIWSRIIAALDPGQDTSEAIVEVCVHLLLVLLAEPHLRGDGLGNRDGASRSISRAISYIEANLGDTLDLVSVGKVAGLSTFHFARTFKAATGLSVHRFIMERRLEAARGTLAATSEPISVIAAETGFSSQSHLTTAFRKRFGLTPRAFRASLGADWPSRCKPSD